MTKRREWDAWHARYMQALPRRVYHMPVTPIISDEEDLEAQRRAGPRPAFEPTERVEIQEVPVDEWIEAKFEPRDEEVCPLYAS
jgi:hypothetical protein